MYVHPHSVGVRWICTESRVPEARTNVLLILVILSLTSSRDDVSRLGFNLYMLLCIQFFIIMIVKFLLQAMYDFFPP